MRGAALLRYRLGTARGRAAAALRTLRTRGGRRPVSARGLPRPRRRRGRPLRLTHALVACDLNRGYLDLWPLVRRGWSEIVGVEPVLVLVAAADEAPAELLADPAVRVFEPLPSLHPALQAQCVRLLYPALLETDGAVVVADVDMVPLRRAYFVEPLASVHEDDFVAYRDVLLHLREIPVCYNAARPATWASVFGAEDEAGVRARLEAWGWAVRYEGTRGGAGWTTDQRLLWRTLAERAAARRDVWVLDDRYTGFRRLERTRVEQWGSLPEWARRELAAGGYSDYHCPGAGWDELSRLVVDLAAGAAPAPLA